MKVYMTPREALNEIIWKYHGNMKDVEIFYLHRGAPDDTMIVKGDSVKSVRKDHIELERSVIPYHRILKITFEGDTIYERRSD